MSIMPQGALPACTDPTNISSALAPALTMRNSPTAGRIAQIIADEPAADEVAEDRLVDIIELLVLAVAVGASRIDLGAVPANGAEVIASALDTERVTYLGDIATITGATPVGELAVTLRIEHDGQVAA
ncbi:hypothetical protein [Streptomyces sp. NRRL B-24484]|uniref:hypothetical protein n=1 Tax=Streptomyces sp. NRRL B-24484 TaxID=1463833 RepID=UPI0004C29DFB|nr:hypothetical protein [Streptomyces sp. NRRL B-24484]